MEGSCIHVCVVLALFISGILGQQIQRKTKPGTFSLSDATVSNTVLSEPGGVALPVNVNTPAVDSSNVDIATQAPVQAPMVPTDMPKPVQRVRTSAKNQMITEMPKPEKLVPRAPKFMDKCAVDNLPFMKNLDLGRFEGMWYGIANNREWVKVPSEMTDSLKQTDFRANVIKTGNTTFDLQMCKYFSYINSSGQLPNHPVI